jgi:hypothetical protein
LSSNQDNANSASRSTIFDLDKTSGGDEEGKAAVPETEQIAKLRLALKDLTQSSIPEVKPKSN